MRLHTVSCSSQVAINMQTTLKTNAIRAHLSQARPSPLPTRSQTSAMREHPFSAPSTRSCHGRVLVKQGQVSTAHPTMVVESHREGGNSRAHSARMNFRSVNRSANRLKEGVGAYTRSLMWQALLGPRACYETSSGEVSSRLVSRLHSDQIDGCGFVTLRTILRHGRRRCIDEILQQVLLSRSQHL